MGSYENFIDDGSKLKVTYWMKFNEVTETINLAIM